MNNSYITIKRDSAVLFSKIKKADTFWKRMFGLILIREFTDLEGLLIIPCNWVHMFWMKIPLDIIFLNHQNTVIHTLQNLTPNTCSPIIPNAHAVLELPINTIMKHQISQGDQLSMSNETV